MLVRFTTNLDIKEEWPDGDYDLLPPLGCLVESTIRRPNIIEPISLQVSKITLKNGWRYQDKLKLYYEIELSLDPLRFDSIKHWQIYYDYHCGKITIDEYVNLLRTCCPPTA